MMPHPNESGFWPFQLFPIMVLGRWPRLVWGWAFGPLDFSSIPAWGNAPGLQPKTDQMLKARLIRHATIA